MGLFFPVSKNVLGWEEADKRNAIDGGNLWFFLSLFHNLFRFTWAFHIVGIKDWVYWLAFHRKELLSKGEWSLTRNAKKGNGHTQKFTEFCFVQAISQYSRTVYLYWEIKLKAIEDILHYIHIFEIVFFLAEGNSVSWSYLVCQTLPGKIDCLAKII